MELVLVTRRDCELCEEMSAVVEPFVAAGRVSLERLDVDADAELQARYGTEVPVLLVNGRKAFKYRVAAADLRRRLRAEKRRSLIRGWRQMLRPGR